MTSALAPLIDLRGGVGNIEADRRSIAKQAFSDVDVLLLPTTTTRVPRVADARANPQAVSPENTAFANYYGLSAISVPCGFDASGLPFGLQIVGKPWDDGSVLRLAHQYQTTSPQPGACTHEQDHAVLVVR
jgi:aspartyl-tRNA(Asn)/glutamyl-tRNA(Gln) amidotransferase subunit A